MSDKTNVLFQKVVTGHLKSTSVDTEIICFTIPLGFVDLIVIVNIPAEGTTTAPVYVKFKLAGQNQQSRPDTN